ncbi:MAG: glycoside hydrolase family 127 protein [Phycisphaerae bacterium]
MRLLVLLTLVSVGAAAAAAAASAAETRVRCVLTPPTDRRTDLYVSSREPLAPSPLVKLPIGAVRPRGWLRTVLETQADGMTGHLTELSKWCEADGNAWLSPDGHGHSPWEELPYWLKGFGDLGYVLGDERIIKESRTWIEGILAGRREDGWFGPRDNLKRRGWKPDFWPNMIALNCLQSYYEATGDDRVLEHMAAYFRFQQSVPDEDFLVPFWQHMRAGDNLESVYWLYNRTGEAWLLEVAEKVHRNTADWTGGVANWHGVNVSQCFREPAVFWMQARERKFRDAAYRNHKTVIDLYGQVPGGMFGADENCRQGYDDPRQAAETCSMVEFLHSFEMLAKITGDPVWADRCEEVAFNDLPASQPADLKGLHYLTAPNQVVLDAKNHSPGIQNGGCMFAYDPHRYRCCQHNHGHGWPYFAEELWLATSDGGLCASLYAASEVTAKVAGGTEVTVTEETVYPFGETIRFRVRAPNAVRFPLYLRIPGWCEGASVKVNGKAVKAEARPLSYLVIDRTWPEEADGDVVTLTLPMRVEVVEWEQHGGAVSVRRGPLWFSLDIGEEWRRIGGTDDWPAYEVRPTTPWNYGLAVDPDEPEASVKVTRPRVSPKAPGRPVTFDEPPILLKAKARKIPQWQLDRHGLVAPLQPSPAYTEEPVEEVTLVPMGGARLRISAFPVVSDAPDAHRWKPPEKPAEPAYGVKVSHCWGGDRPGAIADGLEPKHSDDHSIPRHTFWDHKGTEEWVEARFKEPRTVRTSEVYWFDDTGRGQCRVPESWRLLYRDGDAWKPVRLTGGSTFGTAKDRWNKVTFEPVETQAMRLEVRLQDGVSGGILEWRFGPRAKK